MKPTHYRRNTKERVAHFRVDFSVDTFMIEVAVMHLLDGLDYETEEKELSRNKVEKKLRSLLYERGSSGFEFAFDRNKWMDDVDALRQEAERKAKDLFPEFYKPINNV
jgi:hypothetical protein